MHERVYLMWFPGEGALTTVGPSTPGFQSYAYFTQHKRYANPGQIQNSQC